jgi:hypothetical protein
LLLDLDWKLADATPRKLMLDSGFISGLRRSLGWTKPFDPPLAALHPSLGNLDHIRRYIDGLRKVLFPDGTGFEGLPIAICLGSYLIYFGRCSATCRRTSWSSRRGTVCSVRRETHARGWEDLLSGHMHAALHVCATHAFKKTFLGHGFQAFEREMARV